jgi:outer membrane protein OmpA-like peptidoglycan-associated protein
MKKNIIVLVIFACIIHNATAQRYFGIANSNYAGINGLYINPANIADNRLKVDVQLLSGNVAVNQNYGYLKSFKSFIDSARNGNNIAFTKSDRTSDIGFSGLGEIRLPSFMIQIDKKSAIGLVSRGRLVGSGSGINTDYFTLITEGIRRIKKANGTIFTSGNVNTTVNAFTEIGIVYGREILNTGVHYLKVGGIVKRYNGLAYSSIIANNLTVKLLDTSISKVEFSGSVDIAKSFNNNKGFDDLSAKGLLFGGAGSGFGLDIGAVYEHRINDEDKDEKTAFISTNRYENKYKYKIGFAIQDIGSMSYKTSPNNERYTLKFPTPVIRSNVDTANLSLTDVATYFKSIGATYTNDSLATTVKAPTVITIYGDYKFKEHLYVNALFTAGLVGSSARGNSTPFQAVITPRYESKLFDAGLPISFSSLSQDVKIGLGLRLGIFFIGTDDFISNAIGISKLTSSNFYTGFHIGFPYKKPKADKEIEEETPAPVKKEIPKKIEVPLDTDKDGVIDTEDKCPSVAGLKEFSGCPDTDGDGIQDSEDNCPTEKGLKTLKGCPDTDGDGVADKDDKCIDKPGPIENAGCPKISEVVIKKLNFAAKAIQFETGKDVLTAPSFTQLDEVVKIMNEYTDYQLTIDGHTDNVGKVDKNQLLSQARADAVLNYFTKKGIAAERLVATGYGDTKPLVENNNVANKAKNRRVELNMKLKN